MWHYNVRFTDHSGKLVHLEDVKPSEARWVYFHGGEGRFVVLEYRTDEVVIETEMMLGYNFFSKADNEAKKYLLELAK